MKFIEPDWPAPVAVRALATERGGGVSEGPYASLNLGARTQDDPAAVAENRRRLREAAGLPAEPVWLAQVHGADVVELAADGAVRTRSAAAAENGDAAVAENRDTATDDHDGAVTGRAGPAGAAAPPRIEADAAVTGTPGIVCAVLTADCLPVFLAARDGSRVGVAHAGWRGLAAGVLERAVAAMRTPPGELVAWLGPAIGPAAFEVGDDVVAAFAGAGFDTAAAIRPNARGRWQADLYTLARTSLARAGVHDVRGGGFCTYAEPERFFSHRRDRPCGRMASLIWMERAAGA